MRKRGPSTSYLPSLASTAPTSGVSKISDVFRASERPSGILTDRQGGDAARDILLVEDNEDDEFFTRRAIAKSGLSCRVTCVGDGVEALKELAAREISGLALPHLTLVDLRLPRIGGVELMRRMRAAPATSHLPVIILTGYPEAECQVLLGETTHVTVLAKPLQVASFRNAIHALGVSRLLKAA